MGLINNYKTIRSFTPKENISNFIVYFIYRPLGNLFTSFIFNTNIKPNHVTILKYFFASIALYLIFISNLENKIFFIGYFLYLFSDVLDYVDGSLARSKKLTSKFGRILDTVSDHFFSSLLFFLISIKVDSILHLYFLIIFLSVSWSQVYINTLIKYYKNNINKKKIIYKNLKNKKKIQSNENLSLFKNLFQKLLFIFTFISINLNLITLLIFLYLNLLDEYLLFFFIYKSFLITLNIILILKNNYNFLNTKDYE